ncbi:hypothetical protein GCM10023258_11050 [Terrabacter aeriphilus]|uniref:Lipoprotein n=1 Tax=Terrabacter aeriphilus TaxID=515662 RepID=A0ABP9J7L6_9MICO
MIACVGAALLAGCGSGASPGAGGNSTPVPSAGGYGWVAFDPPPGATGASGARLVAHTPPDALELAGLRLPDGAEVQRVETQAPAMKAESFLFVVRADRASAEAVCDEAGLGGARVVASIPGDAAASMVDPVVGPGSRWCSRADTTGDRWEGYVLIAPGDPATVQISVQRPL